MAIILITGVLCGVPFYNFVCSSLQWTRSTHIFPTANWRVLDFVCSPLWFYPTRNIQNNSEFWAGCVSSNTGFSEMFLDPSPSSSEHWISTWSCVQENFSTSTTRYRYSIHVHVLTHITSLTLTGFLRIDDQVSILHICVWLQSCRGD